MNSNNNAARCRTYISAAKVAQELEVPFEVFQWALKKNKAADGLKKDVDYILNKDGEMFFTLSGLLWAVARSSLCDGNFRGAVPLAEKLASGPDKETQKLVAEHKALVEKLPDIREALILAQETIDAAIGSSTLLPTDSGSRKKFAYNNSKNLPALDKEQQDWSKKTYALLEKKAQETGKMTVHIQKKIYRDMTAKYGIVWEQEKIDALKRFGLDPHEKMTTFRCVCYSETLRSIFGAMLADFVA